MSESLSGRRGKSPGRLTRKKSFRSTSSKSSSRPSSSKEIHEINKSSASLTLDSDDGADDCVSGSQHNRKSAESLGRGERSSRDGDERSAEGRSRGAERSGRRVRGESQERRRSRSMSMSRAIQKITGRSKEDSDEKKSKKKRRGDEKTERSSEGKDSDDGLAESRTGGSRHRRSSSKIPSTRKKREKDPKKKKRREKSLTDQENDFGGHDSLDSLFQLDSEEFEKNDAPASYRRERSRRKLAGQDSEDDGKSHASYESYASRKNKKDIDEKVANVPSHLATLVRNLHDSDDGTESMTSSAYSGRRPSSDDVSLKSTSFVTKDNDLSSGAPGTPSKRTEEQESSGSVTDRTARSGDRTASSAGDLESNELRKQLAEALSQIERLTEDNRYEKSQAQRITKELIETKMQLDIQSRQSSGSVEEVQELKNLSASKDEKIKSLEASIDEHTAKVDFLEERLEQAEEDIWKLETDLKQQIADPINSNEDDGLLVDSGNDDGNTGRLIVWEKKLENRERDIDSKEEMNEMRERRLDEWELDLSAKEDDLKAKLAGAEKQEKHLKMQQRDMDNQTFLLKEDKKLLESDRAKLMSSQQYTAPGGDKSGTISKQRLVECEEEISELRVMLKERDEEIDKLRKEVITASNANDSNEEIQLLQDEVSALKEEVERLEDEKEILATERAKAGGSDQEAASHREQIEMLEMLQKEITEQLADLDEENQELTDRIANEQIVFEDQLREKDELILNLQGEIENLKEDGGSENTDLQVAALLKDMNQLKKENRSVLVLQEKLDQANKLLEQRKDLIDELQGEITSPSGKSSGENDCQVKLRKRVRKLEAERDGLAKKLEAGNKDHSLKMRKKDESISFMKQELARMRAKEGSKSNGVGHVESSPARSEADVQRIEDLEDEIEHWKSVNCELENEVEAWKSEVNKMKSRGPGSFLFEEDLSDDEQSIASIRSMRSIDALSVRSERTTLSQDIFFMSDAQPDRTQEPQVGSSTPTGSSRGGRSLGGLWSKLRAPARPNNPAIPYT